MGSYGSLSQQLIEQPVLLHTGTVVSHDFGTDRPATCLRAISRLDASNSGEARLENFSRSAAMVRARRYNFSSAFAFSESMAVRSASGMGSPSTSATVGSMGP